MFGLKFESGKYRFTAAVRTEQLYLNLYRGETLKQHIAFDPKQRIGDVWVLEIGRDLRAMSYTYEADGTEFSDPNGTVFSGRRRFGVIADGTKILKTPIAEAVGQPADSAAWEKDRALCIPYNESIIYRLHVRGFTKHKASGLPADVRGSFQGVIEKLPYLKELGVTAIELMPPYEFNEVMMPEHAGENPFRKKPEPTGKINYWGFTEDARMLAPKAGYTQREENPRDAFRRLVLAAHASGIEVIADLYVTEKTTPDHMLSVMRWWRIAWHVDGVHIVGRAPLSVISRDPYLSRFKIWADSWDGCTAGHDAYAACAERYLADYNAGFQNDMRRVLKGDENMLGALARRLQENPSDRAVIHYMANTEGMTLMDAVSYDRKHNEANGENNLDGTDENESWNCGEEGRSRKKRVNQLRHRQLKNAWLLLLLSQGTPLIRQGDELGQSKHGNNNTYCQDNALSWLDWGLLERNRRLYEFVKKAIAFRKKHAVFRQRTEPRNLDYKNIGVPDVSLHGENAWKPEFEHYRRQLGVMYSGAYAEDDSFLLLGNFHWETHSFQIPNPPKGFVWAVAVTTAESESEEGFYEEGKEPKLFERRCSLHPRSMKVLRAVPDETAKPETAQKRRGGRKNK